ncbi:MAG: hypothetical protein KBT11_12270, partial [Treponema sp.]|nr:hypothetical protein [Candidatus Treponema equifaecale]
EKYLRPMLEINRQEIESYLIQNNISWCTDSTNLQNDYARNKIRNLLVPFLNENFPQWQEGLVSASEKFQADKLFFEAVVSQKLQKLVKKQTETEIVLDLDKFCSLDFALKQRIVYRMLNSLGFGERFPFKLVKEICSWKNISKAQIKFSKIKIAAKNEKIVFSVLDEAVISEGFSFLFEDLKTEFEHEGIRLFVKKSEEKNLLCVQTEQNCVCCGVKFPFLVRSFQQDDFIKTASGGFKKVSDVFSDWKLDEKQKNKVLVVQLLDSELSLRALFASHFGAQNWIV